MKDHSRQSSFKTILMTVFTILGIYLLTTVSDVILTISLSVVIVLSIEPLINFFLKLRLFEKSIFKRTSAVLASFLIVITILVLTFVYAIPELFREFPKVVETVQTTVEEYSVKYNLNISNLPNINQYTERAVSVSIGFFSNLIAVFSLLLLSIYISLDWDNIKKFLHKALPDGKGHIFDKIILDLESGIGNWVKGQLLLMLFIGVLSTSALYFIGNPFYAPLGLISGILEAVPILGPLISTILAVIVSYAYGGQSMAILTLVAFFLIQQLENNFLVPKIMEKVSGFSPVLILLAFLLFSSFLGVIGAVLAVPILMLINILLKHLIPNHRLRN